MVPPAHGVAAARTRHPRVRAGRRRHRPPLQDLLGVTEEGGRGPGVGRPGRVGGAPPQRPVPILAGLGQVLY